MPDNNTEQLQGSPSSDQRLRVDWDNGNHFDVSPDRYAPHLSEFYPIVNSKRPVASSAGSENNDHLDDMNHLRSSKVYSKARRASSITSGTSTINDLQTLITKRDVKETQEALSTLFRNSNAYSDSLLKTSQNGAEIAHSLENIAKLKGCNDETAEKLLSASGLFYLLSNHQLIMSKYFNDLLGDNLIDDIDEFELQTKIMENKFKAQSKEQSLKLKLQERHNFDISKRKIRNLISYRESLSSLQARLDQLETLKHDFYMDSYELVENTCNKVLSKVATVSRAQVEISENIARKGWSGGGLDELLCDADDPFSKKADGPYGTIGGDGETAGEAYNSDEETGRNDVVLNELLEGTSQPSTSKTSLPKSKGSSTVSTPNHSQSSSNKDGVRNNDGGKNGEDEDTDNLMGTENSFSLPPTRNSAEETTQTFKQLSIKEDNDNHSSDTDGMQDQSSNI
ncbi:Ivy1p [Saccharomyces cerevisiae YJM1273]|nr:Ivy1p [Saccharomyces cerevisiae YJM1273]AJV09161.1 Ivy1p [Saccharomyces cerevisiae YJM1434]CAI4344137.1 AVI_1a_G0010760.mRNA.1.CDS.1 [Saccharomyces cerevisiae]CAI4358328.1 ANE_G0010780.mRNA.1.CDS.1 [Saccharomyces cerevisiae]CAI6565667.1 ANE_G0010780.mRNA.1.CDS.1 [Saccharomyces cerevisiae]